MPEEKHDGGRWAWLSTWQKALAALVALLGLPVAAYKLYDVVEEHRGTPSFTGRIESSERASNFIEFLHEHDDEVVELDIQCVPFDRPAWCAQANQEDEETYGTSRFGDPTDSVSMLEVFGDSPCPDVSERCAGTAWVFAVLPMGADEQVNNGEYGAGALVVKGEYKVNSMGGLGTSPAGIDNITLTAVDEPE